MVSLERNGGSVVKEKSIGDLCHELMSEAGIDSYIKDNQMFFSDQSVAELLNDLYGKKSVTKAALARDAGISEVYLHQVFSGRRHPSRDRLLCICICMGATFDEIQKLLREASFAQLYPKIKRDAIISYGIIHQVGLREINEKLVAEREKPLY